MNNVWETEYRNTRRKARHRCRCCWKAINEGEPVVMARMYSNRRRVWALHAECADKPHSQGVMTWREAFHQWANPDPRPVIQMGH